MLLVVRHGTTTRNQLREAHDRLASVGARVIGAVINRAPVRGGDAYGYGYGCGYGYGSSPSDKKPAPAGVSSSPDGHHRVNTETAVSGSATGGSTSNS